MDSNFLIQEQAAQIADLQERVSFQEDTISALDKVVATQDQEIIAIKTQLRGLVEKIKDAQFLLDNPGAPSQERPPHY